MANRVSPETPLVAPASENTLLRVEDSVLAALAASPDGLSTRGVFGKVRGRKGTICYVLANLANQGHIEYGDKYEGSRQGAWRITGRPVPPRPVPPRAAKAAPRKPFPRIPARPAPRPPLPPVVAPPEMPAVWKERWDRLDGRRAVEVLVTADAEFIYVSQWRRARGGTFLPLKGAMRLYAQEARQLLETLSTATGYLR